METDGNDAREKEIPKYCTETGIETRKCVCATCVSGQIISTKALFERKPVSEYSQPICGHAP